MTWNILDLYHRAFKSFKSELAGGDQENKLRREICRTALSVEHLRAVRFTCDIKTDWIDEIEKGLPFIEKAILENRQFILQQGETLLIEKAKRVSRASVEHLSQVDSKGHMGEFNVSGGFNMQNKVYFGFTLGIVELEHTKSVYYGESYYNNGLDLDASGNVIGIGQTLPSDVPLLYTDYTQRVATSGVGVNLKAGVIYRPTSSLRLGIAFHTPSAMIVDRRYQGQMFVKGFDVPNNKYVESDQTVQYTDELRSTCEYYTPPRLLLGASYTFGQMAIVSVDYEHTWYNGMALDMNAGHVAKNGYKEAIRNSFKGANTLRAGVEMRPLPMLSLRAGYAYYGSMMRDKDAIFDNPIESTTSSASVGVGFNFGSCALDLAYVFQNTQLSTYDLFYYQNASGSFTSASGELNGNINRHQAILTFSVKM